MAPPLATSHVNTIRDPGNSSNNTEPNPSTDTQDWSILTETISYSTPPTADIRVEVSQSLTPPTNTYLFQPYEGVQAPLSATASHDESTDVSTTFISLVSEPSGNPSYQPEHSFPFDTRSCAKASLPNGETFNMLLDTGASQLPLLWLLLAVRLFKEIAHLQTFGPSCVYGQW